MGTTLAVQARRHYDQADIRLVGMSARALLTWQAVLLLADDDDGTYSLGWRELSYATGMVSERTVMRALTTLADVGLVENTGRRNAERNAIYLVHP
jgi:DNA-binding IclR family transcriptional regulator